MIPPFDVVRASPDGGARPATGRTVMTRRFLALLGLLCLAASPTLAQGICPNDFQGRNAALTCQCPPGSTAAGTVWGSGAYTTDSRICRAALHAGAIGAGGGTIIVTPAPGQSSYQGSAMNGVQTQNYGAWGGSFTVAAAGGKGPAGPAVAACPTNFLNQSAPVSCSCAAGGAGGTVWGTGVYTTDSDVCRAARHLGMIGLDGGLVNVVPVPGLPTYAGTSSNGVQTQDYGPWSGSFTFRR